MTSKYKTMYLDTDQCILYWSKEEFLAEQPEDEEMHAEYIEAIERAAFDEAVALLKKAKILLRIRGCVETSEDIDEFLKGLGEG